MTQRMFRLRQAFLRINWNVIRAVILLAALVFYFYNQERQTEALEMQAAAQVAHNAVESGRLARMEAKYDDLAKESVQTYLLAKFTLAEAKEVNEATQELLKRKKTWQSKSPTAQ